MKLFQIWRKNDRIDLHPSNLILVGGGSKITKMIPSPMPHILKKWKVVAGGRAHTNLYWAKNVISYLTVLAPYHTQKRNYVSFGWGKQWVYKKSQTKYEKVKMAIIAKKYSNDLRIWTEVIYQYKKFLLRVCCKFAIIVISLLRHCDVIWHFI